MSQHIKGNIRGLAPSELRKIERLFVRRFEKEEIVPLEIAREIHRVASDLNRRIGMLVSREGRIEEVFVGQREILYLPDLGRYRFGRGRLRRLRLIFSDLSTSTDQPTIPADIYTDLQKLRLDTVVSVKVAGNKTRIAYAYIVPPGLEAAPMTHTEVVDDLGRHALDYDGFMTELENELALAREALPSTGKPQAILLGVYDRRGTESEASMEELEELARTAGVEVLDKIVQKRTVDPKTLLGKGKLEQVVLRSLALGAEMILFDTELKPGQWRIITNQTELKVLDRSMLILDIFAQRARSSEGRLQVELAQLKYNLPRLVEKDTGLSRLSGGIGGRGPGETKLEIGRRRIRDRITELEKRIDKLSEQRSLRRQRRKDNGIPLISILGYTNVGKSTLFNALTQSDVLVENKLFATLEPAQRRIHLQIPGGEGTTQLLPVVLSDTVGFIRALPEELKSAFRATLEELYDAQLLIHVLDASDPDVLNKKAAVEGILEEMEIEDAPTLVVLNKVDRAKPEVLAELIQETSGVPVCAINRQGFDALRLQIAARLKAKRAESAKVNTSPSDLQSDEYP
ncbi:MAG: GTPase HflX [Deltaproteobacteria bacterium]|nr:GTPase HflX [Deltaproteobacteria bacterium]